MKRHVITISGNIASGKSVVSELLAKELNYNIYKASSEFRKMARENNMSIVEFNEYIKQKPEVDAYVDNRTREIIANSENLIVDARLGFFLSQGAYNVFLKSDINSAAERLYAVVSSRGKEEEYSNIEETKKGIQKRERAEKERYMKMYNVDITDDANYALIIDTTDITSDEVARKILEEYLKWLKD